MEQNYGLNSTMVRLQPAIAKLENVSDNVESQFHYGSITTISSSTM